MNRLLIESVEGRILTGITMFVAIMILIGWVVINEPSRMAAFEQQQAGRSIERGGELFGANCASCHGATGYGGTGPGLNNPQLFGHDFLQPVNGEIATRQRSIAELEAQIATLTREREALFSEAGSADPERLTVIQARITEIDAQLDAANAEGLQGQIAAINTELEPLLAERETILTSLQPAIDKGYLPDIEAKRTEGGLAFTEYLAKDAGRLAQAGWNGDLRSFLKTTLIHGRPGTAEVWGGAQMVAWAQTGGGPLRDDQINDLVRYIMNWDKGEAWTSDDLFAVQAFMKLKADKALVSAGDLPAAIGTDVNAIAEQVAMLTGDPARGEAIYAGNDRTELRQRLACASCHLGGAQAPATDQQWANIQNVRLNEAQFAGYTPEQYLIESIVNPNAYVVPSYTSGIMPQAYGEQLSAQDMADIIAYVKSYAGQ